MCGSNTLMKDGKDAVCINCGYRIGDYKELELFLGKINFKSFENGIAKSIKITKGKSNAK